MQFAKWHGLGNDYIIVREEDIPAQHAVEVNGGPALSLEAARAVCDRHFGIGSDGVLVVGKSSVADARMLIHNPDGSYADMCGNGIRMVARYLVTEGAVGEGELSVETEGGVVRPTVLADSLVQVDMGVATTEGVDTVELEDGTAFEGRIVNVGNPHFIMLGDPSNIALEVYGPLLERHSRFPHRSNIEWYRVDDASNVTMRVWERGVGETLACGSGACATGVAAVIDSGCVSPVHVHLPGGTLCIDVTSDLKVTMTGPAEPIFTGTINLDQLLHAKEAVA